MEHFFIQFSYSTVAALATQVVPIRPVKYITAVKNGILKAFDAWRSYESPIISFLNSSKLTVSLWLSSSLLFHKVYNVEITPSQRSKSMITALLKKGDNSDICGPYNSVKGLFTRISDQMAAYGELSLLFKN